MKFYYEGKKENPVAVLIHPMFTTPDCFLPLIEYLKEKYYVMRPCMDGHYKESTFQSVSEETSQLQQEIRKQGFTRIEVLVGVSLGATLAIDYYQKYSFMVKKVYLDGIPMFNSRILRLIGRNKFYQITCKVRKNPERGMEKLDRMFPGMGTDMVRACSVITKESCKGLEKACYGYPIKKIGKREQRRMVFLFGRRESARLCERKLRHHYPKAEFQIKPGYGHCGYLLAHPKAYARMLSSF